jgi:hypothetical protein
VHRGALGHDRHGGHRLLADRARLAGDQVGAQADGLVPALRLGVVLPGLFEQLGRAPLGAVRELGGGDRVLVFDLGDRDLTGEPFRLVDQAVQLDVPVEQQGQ